MGTSLYCTDCGKGLEEYEDVITVESGCIEPLILDGEYGVTVGQRPPIRTLCQSCGSALLEKPQPNRVVIEIEREDKYGFQLIPTVRAERPTETIVIVRDNLLVEYSADYEPLVFGGSDGKPIGKLNTVKEEA